MTGFKENQILPLYIFWGVWRSRNANIFGNIPLDINCICIKICAYFNEIGSMVNKGSLRCIHLQISRAYIMWGFFMGLEKKIFVVVGLTLSCLHCHKAWSFLPFMLEQWGGFQHSGGDYCSFGGLILC